MDGGALGMADCEAVDTTVGAGVGVSDGGTVELHATSNTTISTG
jgi:hypothetical protein